MVGPISADGLSPSQYLHTAPGEREQRRGGGRKGRNDAHITPTPVHRTV